MGAIIYSLTVHRLLSMPFEKNHKLGAHKKILKEDPWHSRWFGFPDAFQGI